ncbi:MAG: YraN family protein [Limnochordia bacterium]|jgi:putative endonuclease
MPGGAKCSTTSLGQAAEREAEAFLAQRGYQLITRNYRCRRGEIDLVAYHDHTLVFVEVRCRRKGTPAAAASVDQHKMRRIAIAASHYLRSHPTNAPCRFDVVCLTKQQDGTFAVPELLPDAFSLNDLY